MNRTTRYGSISALAILLISTSGCGSKSNSAASSSTSTNSTSTTSSTVVETPVLAPLTGDKAPEEKLLDRPALTVKIDGAPAAMPQSGMEKADLIFEEQVEGGTVRYLAVFHSQDADVVGPIRSVRPVDAQIVGPFAGLFAYSGGIPLFVNKLRAQAGVKDVGADVNGDDYYRRKNYSAPHNLFSSTEDLYDKAPIAVRPKAAFVHAAGESVDFALGSSAKSTGKVTAMISSTTSSVWTWDSTRNQFLRWFNGQAHKAESGEQLGARNIVLLNTSYRDTATVDPSGTPVPEANIVGTGSGYVLSEGRIVEVRWSKSSSSGVMTFKDLEGNAVLLLPGTTWTTLVPTTGSITIS